MVIKYSINSDAQEIISDENSRIEIKAGDKVLFFSPGLMTYLTNAGMGFSKVYKNNIEESFYEVFSEVRSSMRSGLSAQMRLLLF